MALSSIEHALSGVARAKLEVATEALPRLAGRLRRPEKDGVIESIGPVSRSM